MLLTSLIFNCAMSVSSLTNDFFDALAADASDLFRSTQAQQALHRCLDNVLRVVGAQALGANVADTGSFHNSTDSAAGQNAGTDRSRLQQDLTGAKDADDFVGDRGLRENDLLQVLLRVGNAFRIASETSAALPRP